MLSDRLTNLHAALSGKIFMCVDYSVLLKIVYSLCIWSQHFYDIINGDSICVLSQ